MRNRSLRVNTIQKKELNLVGGHWIEYSHAILIWMVARPLTQSTWISRAISINQLSGRALDKIHFIQLFKVNILGLKVPRLDLRE